MKYLGLLLAALVVVVGFQTLSRADAPAGATKWEYKILSQEIFDYGKDDKKMEAELNKAGADGWELVTLFGGAVLKRPAK